MPVIALVCDRGVTQQSPHAHSVANRSVALPAIGRWRRSRGPADMLSALEERRGPTGCPPRAPQTVSLRDFSSGQAAIPARPGGHTSRTGGPVKRSMARPLQIGLPLRGLTRPQITLVIPGPAKPSAACALALRQGRGWAGAIPLDKLRVTSDTAPASPDLLLPVATALADIPALALTEAEASDLGMARRSASSRSWAAFQAAPIPMEGWCAPWRGAA